MGGKGHSLLLYLAELCKRKDLKSAAVGKNRTVPTGKFVKSTKLLYKLVARSDVEMIGVAELNLRPDVFQIVGVKRTLDRSAGCDILERRRFYRSVNGCKFSETGFSALLDYLKFCHFFLLKGSPLHRRSFRYIRDLPIGNVAQANR